MTEKPVNQNNLEKCGNNYKQFKTPTQYKTFNGRDLIRNQNNTLGIETSATTLTNVFKTTFTEETISTTTIRLGSSENNLSKYKEMKNIKTYP